jgi:hypothetical protein
MERLKRGLTFWVLLCLSVALPASAVVVKKQLYQAQLKVGVRVHGSSILTSFPGRWEVSTSTWLFPGNVVTKVNLRINGDSRELVLCENGSATYDECTYAADGNLDLDSVVNGTSLYIAGMTGQEFDAALNGGTLLAELNTGAAGNYIRIY